MEISSMVEARELFSCLTAKSSVQLAIHRSSWDASNIHVKPADVKGHSLHCPKCTILYFALPKMQLSTSYRIPLP